MIKQLVHALDKLAMAIAAHAMGTQQHQEAKQAPKRPSRPGWVPLQDFALEHIASGFVIQLAPLDPRADLILRSPEGSRLASGREGSLLSLQQLAELCAREREQFNCAAVEASTLLNRLRADTSGYGHTSPEAARKIAGHQLRAFLNRNPKD